MTSNDIELYSSQFVILHELIGKRVDEVIFYLDNEDENFTEQPNNYGKSLLNGIDIKIDDAFYSIGNRFTESGYGLKITKGRTSEFEFIEEKKQPTAFESKLIGQTITSANIFWMKIPWEGAIGYYPQEFELRTDKGFLLISSIEVNQGEVNTEFTDELLIIENEEVAKELKLGQFGLENNGREYFEDFEKLYQRDLKIKKL